MQPIFSEYQVRQKLVEDLANTLATLELAKESLLAQDYVAARRMLQICQSDLQQNERKLRILISRVKE
ncbi:hypothetical protein [Pasteurella multocida]|uniref:hypothetical protein n=1 Tax=Pasteurella multocida TaxID=747 RepID=UPI00292FD567|nr:hypothetical protein [Pasteurella multocida]WNY75949.1 hypothetical protein H2513_08705 [Pasteurella multocida]